MPDSTNHTADPLWLPLGEYQLDERSGEGPEVLLLWTGDTGARETGIGTGFRYFDDEGGRDIRLFASGGRVRRPTHFQRFALIAVAA